MTSKIRRHSVTRLAWSEKNADTYLAVVTLKIARTMINGRMAVNRTWQICESLCPRAGGAAGQRASWERNFSTSGASLSRIWLLPWICGGCWLWLLTMWFAGGQSVGAAWEALCEVRDSPGRPFRGRANGWGAQRGKRRDTAEARCGAGCSWQGRLSAVRGSGRQRDREKPTESKSRLYYLQREFIIKS